MPAKKISIYQLKISLQDSKPPIWRRIQVKSSVTLGKLHVIIQIVMGWTDSHLHQFIIDGEYFGIPDPDFELEIKNENRYKLESVVPNANQVFFYEYDFGDNWEHKIVVEKILSLESGVHYPICLAGKLACPPEDCGGIWGYDELLEIIKDPNNPEHEEMLEWAGEDFNPEYFDLNEVNSELKYYKL